MHETEGPNAKQVDDLDDGLQLISPISLLRDAITGWNSSTVLSSKRILYNFISVFQGYLCFSGTKNTEIMLVRSQKLHRQDLVEL